MRKITLNPDNVLAPSSGGRICVTSDHIRITSSTIIIDSVLTSKIDTEISNLDQSSGL